MKVEGRNTGVELLRIVLMLFIIIGHLFTHTEIRDEVDFMSIKWVIIWSTQTITVSAVDGFVLISGFYQKKVTLSIEKVCRLWGEVLFYSLTIYCISLFYLGYTGIADFIRALLPITCKQYWFFTIYIFLYILSPFINRCLNTLNKNEFKVLVVIMLLFTVVKPTLFPFEEQYDPTGGFGIVSFITLYIFGAYLSRYKNDIKGKKLLLILSMATIFASKIIFELVSNELGIAVGTGLFYHYNTVFQIGNSILLLYVFKDIHLTPDSRLTSIIGFFSSSVFGVYLIHEHPVLRAFLWNHVITSELLMELGTLEFVGVLIVVPIGIFAISVLLDYLRKLLRIPFLGNKVMKKIEKLQLFINEGGSCKQG